MIPQFDRKQIVINTCRVIAKSMTGIRTPKNSQGAESRPFSIAAFFVRNISTSMVGMAGGFMPAVSLCAVVRTRYPRHHLRFEPLGVGLSKAHKEVSYA